MEYCRSSYLLAVTHITVPGDGSGPGIVADVQVLVRSFLMFRLTQLKYVHRTLVEAARPGPEEGTIGQHSSIRKKSRKEMPIERRWQ